MRRASVHALARAFIAMIALLCCRSAAAQVTDTAADEEGPIVIGQRRRYEKVFFERPEVALSLTNVYQRDENDTSDVKATTNQWLFEQTLEVSTHGYVLSPNLFTLDLMVAGGVNESWIDSKNSTPTGSFTTDDSSIGSIYEWDVSGTLRPNGPTPFTLFSRREQGWVFRQFGGAIETINTETGASLDIRSRKLPTHMGVSHLDSEQNGQLDTDDFSYTRDAFNWSTVYLISDTQRINWDYTFAAVDQRGVIEQKFQTHDARLQHELDFGLTKQHALTSTATYYNQSGDLDLQRFRWDEQLRLRHSRDFRTYYDYTYDNLSVSGSDRQRHRVDAGFIHHLFDSLTTEGNAGIQHVDAEGAESWETFANIDWAYRKNVPLGVFSANLGLSWSRVDADANTEPVNAVDQPANFFDPFPIVITGANVDPNSIIITDPSGLLIYQPGVDYTVTQFPDRVEIERIIGGSILSGQSVLLDYVLTPLPAATTTTNGFNAGVRYDFDEGLFKGLTLFTYYSESNQSIDTDQPSAFVLNDYTDWRYGAEYRIGNLTIGAERQEHDSTVNPFDANRFFARYNRPIALQTVLSLNSAYTMIDYFEPEDRLHLVTASAQLTHRFTQRLSGTFTFLYRYEDDELRGLTRGIEEQLELRWRHRQTDLYVLLRNAQLDNPDQEQSFQFAQVGLRREF